MAARTGQVGLDSPPAHRRPSSLASAATCAKCDKRFGTCIPGSCACCDFLNVAASSWTAKPCRSSRRLLQRMVSPLGTNPPATPTLWIIHPCRAPSSQRVLCQSQCTKSAWCRGWQCIMDNTTGWVLTDDLRSGPNPAVSAPSSSRASSVGSRYGAPSVAPLSLPSTHYPATASRQRVLAWREWVSRCCCVPSDGYQAWHCEVRTQQGGREAGGMGGSP